MTDASINPGQTARPPKSKTEWKPLLEEGARALANAVEIRVHPSQVIPMHGQPREYFSPEAISRLAESIKAIGQVYAGIVRKVDSDRYEIIDGERRWRAVTMVGIQYRASLVQVSDTVLPYLIAAIANFNREGHTPLEVSGSIEKMYEVIGMPIDEIARLLGISEKWAYQMLQLRLLHEDVRVHLYPTTPKEQRLPLTAAITIAKMKPSLQPAMARQVLSKAIPLSSLKSEVVRVSKKSGADAWTPRSNTRQQWSSFVSRIYQIERIATELTKTSRERDFNETLDAGAEARELEETAKALREIRLSLEICEDRILSHRKR